MGWWPLLRCHQCCCFGELVSCVANSLINYSHDLLGFRCDFNATNLQLRTLSSTFAVFSVLRTDLWKRREPPRLCLGHHSPASSKETHDGTCTWFCGFVAGTVRDDDHADLLQFDHGADRLGVRQTAHGHAKDFGGRSTRPKNTSRRNHRLFSAARWSLDALARKRGAKRFGTGMHHDPLLSSRGKAITNWGLSWVVLSVIVELPFC